MHPEIYFNDYIIPTFSFILFISYFVGIVLLYFYLSLVTNDVKKKIVMVITILTWALIAGTWGAYAMAIIEYTSINNILNLQIILRGKSFLGGFIVVFIGLFPISKIFKVEFEQLLYVCSYIALIGYAIGRIGCLLSGDGCYGIPTDLPWGMAFPNGIRPTFVPVHPTPIYESIVSLLLFTLLNIFTLHKNWYSRIKGMYIILALFMVERFLIEFIRLNIVYNGLTMAQWTSLIFIILFLLRFYFVKKI